MSENIIETNKNGTAGTEKPEKKHSGLSRILNKYFHHIDRGGSMKSEITAGCLMCILSVCGMFMNMQLITTMTVSGPYAGATVEQIAANGEIIAGTYFISMLIAFLGSLAIGLIARLPLVQVSGLGLSTVMISLVGTKSGLTYYNLLAVCFVSAILYAVAVSLPFVRKFLFKAIPASVRKAVPAAVGVMIAFVGLQLSGIVTVNGSSLPAYGAGTELGAASDSVGLSGFLGISLFNYSTDRFHPTLLLCCISALLAIVLIFIFKARKAKHPYLWSLLISTAFLIVTCVLTVAINWKMMKISFDSLLGRAWMIGSEDAMQTHLSAVFSNFSFGKVFREGFDFSAYTAAGGSVFLLFVTGVLTMLFAFSCHNEATLTAVYNDAGLGEADRKARRLALMCNAGMNIAAPLFGGSPVSIGQESCAGAGDNAEIGTRFRGGVRRLLSLHVRLDHSRRFRHGDEQSDPDESLRAPREGVAASHRVQLRHRRRGDGNRGAFHGKTQHGHRLEKQLFFRFPRGDDRGDLLPLQRRLRRRARVRGVYPSRSAESARGRQDEKRMSAAVGIPAYLAALVSLLC